MRGQKKGGRVSEETRELDLLCVNTIRMLALDMIEKAHSGHPGLPLGAATCAYVLWAKFLRHNPADPSWPNRDRFILSAGHGSALLYALLHLSGYDLPLSQLQRFRQWGSKTPGHPEHGLSEGVEATTGPLGQGFAMGVGMALAEQNLALCLNKPELPIIDHYTYALVSDGDLMEGVSSEAASLAGTMKLSKLIYLYDDNHICIEGDTGLAFTENVQRRFEAYGWQVLRVEDGNDIDTLEEALLAAQHELEKPSLIMARNHIGYGSPWQDSARAHGEPLGPRALRQTRQALGWPANKAFHVPAQARRHFARLLERGRKWQQEWQRAFDNYRQKYPAQAREFRRRMQGKLPSGWEQAIPGFVPADGPLATRSASGKIMNAIAGRLPEFLGGSADLAPSTKTRLIGYGDLGFGRDCSRNIHFGVREHAMAAIVNGMALHGGLIPYAATFLVFSDYLRPALRLAALMNIHSIFIFTHDSIGLGEDGPTHQPIEHLASLRAIPNLIILRPAEANETAAAWRIALASRRPAALILARQDVPVLDATSFPIAQGVKRGAYVLCECRGKPDIILIATGSEVHPALQAQRTLAERGIEARLVSMPCWELFAEQSLRYQNEVLPPEIPRLAVEAGVSLGWERWLGKKGRVIAIDRFGASAPGEVLMRRFGFSPQNIVSQAETLLERSE